MGIIHYNFGMKPLILIFGNRTDGAFIFARVSLSQGRPIIIRHGYVLEGMFIAVRIFKIEWSEVHCIKSVVILSMESNSCKTLTRVVPSFNIDLNSTILKFVIVEPEHPICGTSV